MYSCNNRENYPNRDVVGLLISGRGNDFRMPAVVNQEHKQKKVKSDAKSGNLGGKSNTPEIDRNHALVPKPS